ncbi:AAA family ATPase [Methanolobus sp.]|uniref:AAA family ATPase n=1 Tax=Methanolobus sp. TaxID=1874737 RepID=UPI0025FD0499|nr:AAA family ATPase [Methanolobus sp.]
MRIKRLQIENIRSYKQLDISFQDGVTVVSGVNGSGKSSLLEACFTCLFGSKTLDKDFVISDIIRKGATKASIMLDFEQNGHDYSVEQFFRNDPEKGRASNTGAILKRDSEILFDQPTRTYDAIRSLLNMDEEAYRNCVYIRQGEIDILINSKPKDRQKMIDDLLQLGKLEEYRERASNARIGVGRHQKDTERRIKETDSAARDIEDSKPVEKLAELRTRSGNLEREISSLNDKKDRALSLKDETSKKIAEFRELADKKVSVQSQVKELDEKKNRAYIQIGSMEKSIASSRVGQDELRKKIRDVCSEFNFDDSDIERVISGIDANERSLRDRISNISKNKAVLEKEQTTFADSLAENQKQVHELEKSVSQSKGKLTGIQSDIEASRTKIAQLEEKRVSVISNLEPLGLTLEKLENIEEIFDLVTDQQKSMHGKEKELFAKFTEIQERIKKSAQLLSEGKCPTCMQDLKGSCIEEATVSDSQKAKELQTELAALKKKQEILDSKLGRVREARVHRNEIESTGREIKSSEENIRSLEKLALEYQSLLLDHDKRKEELSSRRSLIEESVKGLQDKVRLLKQELEVAEKGHSQCLKLLEAARKARTDLLEADRMKTDISQMEDKITNFREMIVIFDGQVAEKNESLREISSKVGGFDITKLESLFKDYEEAFGVIRSEIVRLQSEREEITKQAGMIESELKRLGSLRIVLDQLNNKVDYLNAIYADAQELEAMYMRIRSQLRSNNIGALDTFINEIFTFMYTNNAYSHVRLDADYNLTVFEKDGTSLEPRLLSGGERALFNLVLRCAIYRLLSLGIAGKKAELPPLIMDEPTVFLDKGHVNQLIKLIDMMRDIGVGQILVVSHDESLIDSADHVFAVEKDSVTNSSAIIAK